MIEKIEILKDNNDKLMLDAISAFGLEFNGVVHNFCISTNNELDQNGLVKLLVSEITNGSLAKITDEALWGEVKNVMRAIISSSSYNYSYIKMPTSINASGDFFRVIAVQEAAKTQLISDYVAKRPVDMVNEPVKNVSLVDNPAIYPTDKEPVNGANELTPGISYTNPVSPVNNTEPVGAVNVMASPVTDVPDAAAADVSMDDLVKAAIERSEEPTPFNANENNKQTSTVPQVDASKLVNELENYIRLVVRDELNKN